MAPLVSTIDVARPQDEVFSYVTDPARFAEWQENIVSGHIEGDRPPAVGSKCMTTRRIGLAKRPVTSEITAISPPRSLECSRHRRPDQGSRQGHRGTT